MGRKPGGCLLFRRRTELIEAQTMSSDSGQQLPIRGTPVNRLMFFVVASWINRRPFRAPQWIHSRHAGQTQFANVAAACQDRDVAHEAFIRKPARPSSTS